VLLPGVGAGAGGGAAELPGGVDEADQGERLRCVAEVPAGDRIVFLGEQTDVVAQSEEPLEQLLCLSVTACAVQGVDEPEAAGREGTPGRLRPWIEGG
jgi:hypothetical protein